MRRWDELTTEDVWPEVDAVAVLPLGAVEQHGPHLPLATDRIIAEGLVEAACESAASDVSLLVLPTLWAGTSSEHDNFDGTLSLDPATLETTLVDLGSSVARSGIRRLVVANAHGGNRATLDTAALRLRVAHDMLVVKANYFRFPRPDDVSLPDEEWRHGLHGGAVETAMMMHLRPHLVRSDAIRSFPSFGEELDADMDRLGAEGEASFAWIAGDLNADGVAGNAKLATVGMGERLVRHYAGCLADVLRDAARFPLERLTDHL